MAELIGLFGKLLKDTHNAEKQGHFLPNSASAFRREVYRRRSHNMRSTCYSWLGLIVHWVKASTIKLLAADLLSIFAGVFQGRSRECYPQFKLAHCCFPNVFQVRFFYPSSKKQKIWDHSWCEINVFFSSWGTKNLLVFFKARILSTSLHKIIRVIA